MSTLPHPITIYPPSGLRSRLGMIEFSPEVIKSSRQIRSPKEVAAKEKLHCTFGNFKSTLEFDAWSLYHAAAKVAFATTFSEEWAEEQGLTLWWHYRKLFDWTTSELRRVERSLFEQIDYIKSTSAGQFSEAVAYLVMVKQGYIYWDRAGAIWQRTVNNANIDHSERLRLARLAVSQLHSKRPDLEPDFVMEKVDGSVALMEAKGSFVNQKKDKPNVKGDLSRGLDQLASWSKLINPIPGKSFVVGTYFRDRSDPSDPSFIAVVDPPADRENRPFQVEWNPDWIRRANYGAWLRGMGFRRAGAALEVGARIDTITRRIFVHSIAGRKYVFTPIIAYAQPWIIDRDVLRWFIMKLEYVQWYGKDEIMLFEMDLEIIRAIEESLATGRSLRKLETAVSQLEQNQYQTGDGFSGSVMPDGTACCSMRLRDVVNLKFEFIKIE